MITTTIKATDETIYEIVKSEIERFGTDADLNHIDVSEVTDMMNLFWGSEFNGDISQWDESNVTDMSDMFLNSQFDGDITKWNINAETKKLFMMGMEAYDVDNWQDGEITGCVGVVAYMVDEKDEDRPYKLVKVDS